MEATTQLKKFKEDLDRELAIYFAKKIAEASKISPESKELIELIADLTLRGGKRIRAALMYYSYIAHGGKDRELVLKASMSLELSETYLLIHDDIMDNDSLRRSGKTIHESYRRICNERFRHKIPAGPFGKSIALLAGDISCALSNELIAESGFDPQNINKALLFLNKVYEIEGYGQMLDILSQLKDVVTVDDVTLVHELKTVPYTFDGPVKIGAILAGADEASLRSLEGYSVPLGTAFQIQDDILGMFGTVQKTGKPVLSDLKEGKKTLLILEALKNASAEEAAVINDNLGRKKASIQDLKNVRKVIDSTGSLENSKKVANKLVDSAFKSMESLSLEKEGKDFLLGIADWMVKREY